MPKSQPPIREGANYIQIDAKKGRWPWIQAVRHEDNTVSIAVDMNEGGQMIGTGVGTAGIRLSKKKIRLLREFLERTEDMF
jgi:hypothetical protein